MGDEPRGDLGLARGRTRPRLVATDAIGWGASMFSQKPVRTSRSARSHVLTRFILLTVAATVTALLSVPAASAASTCQDSSPAGTYVIRVCIDTPAGGATLSGQTTVTATPSVVSGTGPGFQRMVFSLNGQYLLTDYSTPYTFTLDTRRFVDGSYTLAAHALLRDTNSTPDTTVSLTFNNGITTPPVNTTITATFRLACPPNVTPQLDLFNLGMTRIGTSAGISILKELEGTPETISASDC